MVLPRTGSDANWELRWVYRRWDRALEVQYFRLSLEFSSNMSGEFPILCSFPQGTSFIDGTSFQWTMRILGFIEILLLSIIIAVSCDLICVAQLLTVPKDGQTETAPKERERAVHRLPRICISPDSTLLHRRLRCFPGLIHGTSYIAVV